MHNLDPIAVQLGPIKIYWYGIMYVLGFLLVNYYCKRKIRQGTLDLTTKQLDSLMTWLVVGLVAGARLGLLLWEPQYILQPIELLQFWEGGLSFHGGLAGVLAAAAIWSKKNKKNILHLANHFIVPISLAQAFVRIGNFINAELYGTPTSLPWAVVFPGAGARHPTQLYEAAYNVIIFVTLYFASKKGYKNTFGLFLILYAIFRTLTEFYRAPDVMLWGATLPQLLNIPLLMAGIWILKKY